MKCGWVRKNLTLIQVRSLMCDDIQNDLKELASNKKKSSKPGVRKERSSNKRKWSDIPKYKPITKAIVIQV